MNLQGSQIDPDIESELQKFIQLLQKSQRSRSQRSSRDMGKLSIIYSASESESSRGDKQNSNSQANHSFQSRQLMQNDSQLIKELEVTTLTNEQRRRLNKIKKLVNGLKGLVISYQEKYKSLQQDYQKQKKGSDELMNALIQMDAAEKEVWNAYNQLNTNYTNQKQIIQALKLENSRLTQQVQQYAKDNEFMKKLVLVANQNYEILDRKCKLIERQNSKDQLSSRSIMSRTLKTKKQSYSPSGSDLVNLSPRKEEFQGIYRKMVLRTLKSKCKKNHH